MSDTPPAAAHPQPTSPPPASVPPPHPGIGPKGALVLALGAAALAILLLLAWSWNRVQTSAAPGDAANAFFHKNADEGSAVAWAEASPSFRNTPLSEWDAESRQLRLAGFYSAEWDPAVMVGGQATLHGHLKVLNSPDLGADVELRRTRGDWRVSWLHLWGGASGGYADASGQSPAVDAQTYASNGQTSLPAAVPPLAPASGSEPAVLPVAPANDGSMAVAPPLGRAGPAGTAMAAGQIGPTCMNVFWKQGYHNDKVDCPLYLPTIPGRSEQCVVHGMNGTARGATVTFTDWDPATNQGSYSCVLHP